MANMEELQQPDDLTDCTENNNNNNNSKRILLQSNNNIVLTQGVTENNKDPNFE